jgi:hypothetical protein
MGAPAKEKEIIGPGDVGEMPAELLTEAAPTTPPVELPQAPDTPGNDENGDGLAGGQTTADVPGDVLGI